MVDDVDKGVSSFFYQRIISFRYTSNYTGEIEKDKKLFLEYCRKHIPFIFIPNVLEQLEKAIDLVYELFKDDRRRDGSMFYTHFLETAHILINKFNVDDIDTIIAALLHDTLEDKKDKISYEDIKKMYNQNVADIVEGVTKITNKSEVEEIFHNKPVGNFDYQHQELATIQKIFTYGLKNPRIFLVKFADRFHNMLTLYGIPKTRRRREIAEETVNIYVQLMKTFGFEEPAKELRDLCLFHLITDNPEEAEKIYKQLLKIHDAERLRFIEIAQQNDIEEKLIGIIQSVSDKISLLVGHKTLSELYDALLKNPSKVSANYQHFYWIIDIPSDIFNYKVIENIENNLKNKFPYISTEKISNIQDRLPSEIIQYLPLIRSYYLLPTNDRLEIVYNVSSSEKQRFDINKIAFKKEYHQSYDVKEYNAFIELIEYLYNKDDVNRMELLLEYAKKIYPTEYVRVKDNLKDTYYLVPNGFTILDLAFKLMPEKAFHVIGARISNSDGQWESKSLGYILKDNDVFELIIASSPLYELENLRPYSLHAINEIRKLQQRIESKEIQPKEQVVKTIFVRGLDKTGLGAQILDIGKVLNIPFTKLNLGLHPISQTEFYGSLTGKYSSLEKFNIFLIELAKIPEIIEIIVDDKEPTL
ncbi:MAG: HD domain-containing protein [Ignavibacteria bacterium]|nr:HD domain-containing protein [Ignavibacteria bacterium]